MKNKITIAFLAPETKWWAYYIYKDLVSWLREQYSDKLEIYFFNSKKDWLKLHFNKYDFIISIIPFLFKPIWAKKYIFNPRGNFEIEKKVNKLWNKLLYLAKNNISFSDNIWITSYFIADKLNFREKFNDKIVITPDFIKLNLNINSLVRKEKKLLKSRVNILTVSSTKFFEKWMWILDLKIELSKIKNKNIEWTIIAWWNDQNKNKIKSEFDNVRVWKNIKINWIDWLEKEKLNQYYKKTDIFLYWTRLETWWWTIMEAMNHWIPIILLDYELWKYIYPKEIISSDIEKQLNIVINDYSKYSKISVDFVKNFDREIVIDTFFKKLIKINNNYDKKNFKN